MNWVSRRHLGSSVFCVVSLTALAWPPGNVANAAPATASRSPLQSALECERRGDHACVIRLLRRSQGQGIDQGMTLRLLGFAYALSGQRALAVGAFTRWLQLSDRHLLRREPLPVDVWEAYQRAWQRTRGGRFDLRPRVTRGAELPAPPQVALPRFDPPTLSKAGERAWSTSMGLLAGWRSDAGLWGAHVGVHHHLQAWTFEGRALVAFGQERGRPTLLTSTLGIQFRPLSTETIGLTADVGGGVLQRGSWRPALLASAGIAYTWRLQPDAPWAVEGRLVQRWRWTEQELAQGPAVSVSFVFGNAPREGL